MALPDTYNAASAPNTSLGPQIQQAFRVVAATVYAEPPDTQGHATRAAFANQVLSAGVNWQN